MQQWLDGLQQRMQSQGTAGGEYRFSLQQDAENALHIPVIEIISHGLSKKIRLQREFFASNDYRSVVNMARTLDELIEDGAYVVRGERRQPVSSFKQALDWLLAEGSRRLVVQRYKGLGEMNPEQLWETTMDPNSRRMLQVTIEDAIAADQLFNTLMGDHVEPRREFIEENALAVSNLDF